MAYDAMRDVLSSSQIECNLRSHPVTRPYFEGVFALDQLPTFYLTHRPSLVVCNTAYSKSAGEHWVCFFLSSNDVDYFDSYGCPPSNSALTQFIAQNGGSGRRFNTTCLQSVTASTCGKYVVTYLLFRSLGLSHEMSVNEFKGGDPDAVVRKLYNCIFGSVSDSSSGQVCRSWCI